MKSSQIKALLFGLLITVFLYFCIEMVCGVLLDLKKVDTAFARVEYPAIGMHINDSDLGYKPKPNIKIHSIKTNKNGITYQPIYSIDKFSRRVTPVQNPKNRKKFALFFGCSFTFGTGVNDNETMPYYFSKYAKRYVPYNYAFQGYGPQQMLLRLQSENLQDEVKEKDGVLIYTFIDAHIGRAIISSMIYNIYRTKMPYFKFEEDKLIKYKNFAAAHPFLSLISSSGNGRKSPTF